MGSGREREEQLERWAKQLKSLLVKGSVPGEVEGFSPAAKSQAARFAADALSHRKGDIPAIAIESFARAGGERQMRLAIANDDMPFLVDTVAAVIARHGLIISRLLHPVVQVSRDANGDLTAIGSKGTLESLIYIECDRGDARTRMSIREELRANLAAVRAAVADWRDLEAAMRADADKAEGEDREFLTWAASGRFTLLGKADFAPKSSAKAMLGLAHEHADALLSPTARAAAAKALAPQGCKLLIVKSNFISPVHRAVPLDLLITPLAGGGIRVHAGLWTSSALSAAPEDVPILAKRLEALQASFGFRFSGHAGKALTHAVAELPHDIAVSISEGDLARVALTAMSIADRPRIAVELVRAPLDRHVFGFVWLPRDELTTARRIAIAD
jgi:glutamate dehydrogenase